MTNEAGPNVVYNGLVVYFDAANSRSYPGSGTTWTDIVGSRSATLANGATFSNNSMVFNGTSAIITFSISGIDFSSAQTIIMALKPNENDGNRRNPYNNAYAGYGTITHEPSGIFNYYHGTSGTDGATYQGTTSTMTVAQNENAIIAVSRGSSSVKWYKNGILSDSVGNSYPTAVSSTNGAYIGYGYAGAYSGNIYLLMMYNRQLTDTEILQNFNALKGRYGL